ncbi:uncharacterized protein LOC141600667 [Silene latifolia]|uniref:uncharacterized protein LOC141600667 n=1 Tax=Silene latifolia TaxID=37657 RepID=UPI003D78ADCD
MTGDNKLKGTGGGGPKTIPTTSPLYLHPSENPNLNVTQIVFNGNNYDLWAEAVKNGLDAKNKLDFLEGKVAKPELDGGEETVETVAWRQCNAMIRAWLRNVIDEKLHPSITFTQPVAEIWEELRARYSAGNAPRVHQLKSELNECKQGNDTVVEYYTRLKTIWDELGNYSKIKACTCGAAKSIIQEREEEKVHQFLMGLDSKSYGNLRTNLLMEDPIANLNRAYAIVLREERHASITKVKEDRVEAAMAVRSTGGQGRNWGQKSENEDTEPPPRCSACGKYYHTEESCYQKHGYEAVISRGRGRGRRGSGRGNHGRGRGRNHENHQANAVGNSSGTKESDSTQRTYTFTSEEFERLKLLLRGSPEGDDKLKGMKAIFDVEWMLDSGCSHHMTGKQALLENIWIENGCSTVSLPDGRRVETKVHGEIRLSETFDLSTRMMIGRGEHRHGVYYLKTEKKEMVARTIVTKEAKLWHKRLGHPSKSIFLSFSDLIGSDLQWTSDTFGIKDLGKLKFFLGIEVAHGVNGLFLNQRKYAINIVEDNGMAGAKTAYTPIQARHNLGLAKGPVLHDVMKYRRLVGRLVYLTITRPDLVYSVHVLSQFVNEPKKEHWDAALRVVQ